MEAFIWGILMHNDWSSLNGSSKIYLDPVIFISGLKILIQVLLLSLWCSWKLNLNSIVTRIIGEIHSIFFMDLIFYRFTIVQNLQFTYSDTQNMS